jgi:hypothetical protein
MPDTTHQESAEEARIGEAATAYLRQKKQWRPTEFRLQPRGTTPDGRCAVLWAVYLEDERTPTPGGGKSVELYIDRGECRVVRELRFQ